MTSKKIETLSEDDLEYLNRLLHTELHKAYPKDSQKLLRLIDAVASQKRIQSMLKW
jgi:hypothetical protein